MIDLLLVNPGEQRYQRLESFKKAGLNCKVLLTLGFQKAANYVLPEDIVLFKNISSVTTAIGFGARGLDIVEDLNSLGKIILGNSKDADKIKNRKDLRLVRDPAAGDWILEFTSYKGRHVLCHAMFYHPSWGWKMIIRSKQDLPFFSNLVEDAIEFLDNLGILNGPTQVNFSSQQEFNIRPNFGGKTIKVPAKQFDLIWPAVLSKESVDPRLAMSAFYNWAEENGSSKRFEVLDIVTDVSLESQTSNPTVD